MTQSVNVLVDTKCFRSIDARLVTNSTWYYEIRFFAKNSKKILQAKYSFGCQHISETKRIESHQRKIGSFFGWQLTIKYSKTNNKKDACSFDILLYLTPLGQARQFMVHKILSVEGNLLTCGHICYFCPGNQKINILTSQYK